jgi:hypothetical protein
MLETVRLHYKIGDKETIEYCDVISLSVHCKYFKFPISHPVVHGGGGGEVCKYVRVCLRMNGLIKCTVVRPKGLYHLVLPYRCFYFECGGCVHDRNTSEECRHFTDAERALDGTWDIDKVRLAVEKGYKILQIHEIC